MELKEEILKPIDSLDKLFVGWNLEEIKRAYLDNKMIIELLRKDYNNKINMLMREWLAVNSKEKEFKDFFFFFDKKFKKELRAIEYDANNIKKLRTSKVRKR